MPNIEYISALKSIVVSSEIEEHAYVMGTEGRYSELVR